MRGTLISMVVAGAIALTVFAAREHARADHDGIGRAPGVDAIDDAVPMQASCGDSRCAPPEDCHSCPEDCGSCCGDRRCAPPEDCRSCPEDCGSCCGDGRCAPPEDCRSCPQDCGRC